MDCAVSAYANNLLITGRANSTPLAGTGNSDTRHTDKLLSAGSATIAAFLTVEVVINISPISMHRFTAAFADKHTATFCTAYRAVILLFPAAADAAGHGANRHLTINKRNFFIKNHRLHWYPTIIFIYVRTCLFMTSAAFPINFYIAELLLIILACKAPRSRSGGSSIDPVTINGFLKYWIPTICAGVVTHRCYFICESGNSESGCEN